jgi:hypothetical protein
LIGEALGLGYLLDELGRHLRRFVVVALEVARAGSLDLVEGIIGGQLIEDLSDLRGRELLVPEPLHRRHRASASGGSLGREQHGLVPRHQTDRAAHVRQFDETRL